MVHFVFEDKSGKLCSIFDLDLIHTIYLNWDFTAAPDIILDWTKNEIENMSKRRMSYEESEFFREKETKDFLVNQTNNTLLHLNRLKRFLEEGIEREYKLLID